MNKEGNKPDYKSASDSPAIKNGGWEMTDRGSSRQQNPAEPVPGGLRTHGTHWVSSGEIPRDAEGKKIHLRKKMPWGTEDENRVRG